MGLKDLANMYRKIIRVMCSVFLFMWSQAFARRMTAVVLAFACAFGMVHIGIGKFGQWHTDSDLVEQYTSAIKLKEMCIRDRLWAIHRAAASPC